MRRKTTTSTLIKTPPFTFQHYHIHITPTTAAALTSTLYHTYLPTTTTTTAITYKKPTVLSSPLLYTAKTFLQKWQPRHLLARHSRPRVFSCLSWSPSCPQAYTQPWPPLYPSRVLWTRTISAITTSTWRTFRQFLSLSPSSSVISHSKIIINKTLHAPPTKSTSAILCRQ